ncbi:MAG TPA: hypothetical protein ENN31_00320 [Candidatus Vogelbacteria bacterium]|nr:hypothetical protein [Candidatus Vogelbacteria bacterium]
MTNIIPAILENNFEEIKRKLSILEDLSDWAQIDISDGIFTPRRSWMTADDLKEITGQIKIEVHLMVDKPEEYLFKWSEVADAITVHWEALNSEPSELIEAIKVNNCRPGLAFNLDTPLEEAYRYIEEVKFVQLMAIEKIGYQGQVFSDKVLERIRAVKKNCPNSFIQIDGGIDLETGQLCLSAGADALVVGSALWQNDSISVKLKELKNIK